MSSTFRSRWESLHLRRACRVKTLDASYARTCQRGLALTVSPLSAEEILVCLHVVG